MLSPLDTAAAPEAEVHAPLLSENWQLELQPLMQISAAALMPLMATVLETTTVDSVTSLCALKLKASGVVSEPPDGVQTS